MERLGEGGWSGGGRHGGWRHGTKDSMNKGGDLGLPEDGKGIVTRRDSLLREKEYGEEGLRRKAGHRERREPWGKSYKKEGTLTHGNAVHLRVVAYCPTLGGGRKRRRSTSSFSWNISSSRSN